MSVNLDSASPKKSPSSSQNQQQQILLPHGQGHVTIPHGQVHMYSDKSSNPTNTTTTTTTTATATGAGQRLLTAREREALIEDLQLEAQTRIRKLRSHYELAARALRAKILMRINRVPRRYWDMTLRELQTRSSSSSGLMEAGVNAVKKTGEGGRVMKSASTGSKSKPNNSTNVNATDSTSGGSVTARTSTVSTAATAAAAIRRTGRVAAGVRRGTALSAEAGRRGLTRSLRSRGN